MKLNAFYSGMPRFWLPPKILLIMRLIIIIMTTCLLQVSAATFGQKVTLVEKNVPLEKVFQQMRLQTGYDFLFDAQIIKSSRSVNLDLKNVDLEEALKKCLEGQELEFTINDQSVIVTKKTDSFLEKVAAVFTNIDLRGIVLNAEGNLLSGASVKVKGTNKVVNTNAKGEFTLTGLKEDAVLVISYIGYEVLEIPAKEVAHSGQVILKENIGKLDETVIMAYGTTSQRLNTGSIGKVTAREIGEQPVSNPLAALQGRVPGLEISPASGLSGAAFKVQIRGKNSVFSGTEPLFIIDGVSMAAGNQGINTLMAPFEGYSGVSATGASPFNSINPADIESVEVLKDADATAIYGSRGANGVILITTKKGRAGKTSINANVYSGGSKATSLTRMLNSQQYLQMRNEAFKNDGITPDLQNAYDLLVWDTTRYTDWRKMVQGGTAKTTDAQASMSGGSETTQFLISTGYHRETSVFPTTAANRRVSLSTGINHQSIDKKLSIGLSGFYTAGFNKLPGGVYDQLPPIAPSVYNAAGGLNWGPPAAPFINPIAIFNSIYEIKTDNLNANLQLGYKITPDLQFRSGFGYNAMYGNEISLSPQSAQDPNSPYNVVGTSAFGTNNFKSLIIEPQLEYAKKIFKGNLTALLGGSWQMKTNSGSAITATDYTNDALLRSLSAAPTIQSASNNNSEYKYAALFGRITYNIDDKYIVNLSGRRDGSSRFGPGKKYANFGAIGAAWILSNESWIKDNIHVLSYAKLRGSYGVTGNDQISDYKYLDIWSARYFYQGTYAVTPDALFNPGYNWERNKKLEGAIELGLWNNRVLATFSYYRNRSDNQLVLYNLPSQTGFSYVTANLPALIQNSGVEITLNTEVIHSKKIKWTVGANLTIPRNKLLAFPNILTSPYAATYSAGQSVNAIKGYISNGIDPATGVYTFADLDGDGILSPKDFTYIANPDPKYYGGIHNSFTFKGIELSLFLEGKKQTGKNYLFSIYDTSNPPGFMYNQPAEIFNLRNEIQKFTTVTTSEAYSQINNIKNSSASYSDASYIRLKTFSISYNIAPLFKSSLKTIRLSVQGQNLFTITKYKFSDPEIQDFRVIPPLKTLTAGLQLIL